MSEEENIERSTDDSRLPTEDNSQSLSDLSSNYKSEISKSEIENMEVHKHSHHVTHKKKFGEYLLEFLMLFLAVFLGFVAENLREENIEHKRENEYMHSLVKDLQLDTTVLGLAAKLKEQRYLAIDSVLQYFSNNIKAKKMPFSTYKQIRRSQWDMFFIHHSGTVDQLKNSGGLRLIRNQKIIDSIELYYQQVQRSEIRNSMYFENQQSTFAISEKLLQASDNIKYQDSINTQKFLTNTDWLSINNDYLNEYLNNLVRLRWMIKSDRTQFTVGLKDRGARLINLIKNEYHLE